MLDVAGDLTRSSLEASGVSSARCHRHEARREDHDGLDQADGGDVPGVHRHAEEALGKLAGGSGSEQRPDTGRRDLAQGGRHVGRSREERSRSPARVVEERGRQHGGDAQRARRTWSTGPARPRTSPPAGTRRRASCGRATSAWCARRFRSRCWGRIDDENEKLFTTWQDSVQQMIAAQSRWAEMWTAQASRGDGGRVPGVPFRLQEEGVGGLAATSTTA